MCVNRKSETKRFFVKYLKKIFCFFFYLFLPFFRAFIEIQFLLKVRLRMNNTQNNDEMCVFCIQKRLKNLLVVSGAKWKTVSYENESKVIKQFIDWLSEQLSEKSFFFLKNILVRDFWFIWWINYCDFMAFYLVNPI